MTISIQPSYLKILHAGTKEHYQDAILYDYEYRRRRDDVVYYRKLAQKMTDSTTLRILELGCGTGRILTPLIRDGHKVVGVDRSTAMLQRCRNRLQQVSAKKRINAHLIQADFRSLPVVTHDTKRFPLILCPFNTFMHLYTRVDVEKFLNQVKCHLATGGLFVFDLLNPDLDWLCRDSNRRFSKTRFTHPATGEILTYSTNHLYDPVHQIALIRVFYEPANSPSPSNITLSGVQPQTTKVIHMAHRQFFPAELETLLKYNGFTIEHRDGDFQGHPFSSESQQQIIHAKLL